MRKTNEKFRKLIFALVLSLLSFWTYSRHLGDDYSGMNLLWGVLVTIGLVIFLYLFPFKKIKRFSVAWGIGISVSMAVAIVGMVLSSPMMTGVLNAWAEYMIFLGLFGSIIPIVIVPKEYKRYKGSFFKRVRPIEDESNQ